MSTITVHLETPIRRSFRVEQVAGMFDVALEERMALTPALSQGEREMMLRHELTAEVPGMEEEWTIGAIVGPSGSGKTTLARAAFGEAVHQAEPWPVGRAVIEVLGQRGARNGERGPDECCSTLRVPSSALGNACCTIREITRVLCGVGLGSVPTWLKPYEVLSTGEKFRAELARALVGRGILTHRHRGTEETGERECGCRLVVVDEFTSSLDRVVAKTTSAAVARLLRESMEGRRSASLSHPTWPRFVAVTCHDDVLPWLSPDWVIELRNADFGLRINKPTASNPQSAICSSQPRAMLTRQRFRRSEMRIHVERVPQAMWARFAPHHYLAGQMAASATCYAARWEGEIRSRHTPCAVNPGRHTECAYYNPIGFCAVAAALGWKKTKRIQRLVVLPEFQGLGVGGKLLDAVAGEEASKGNRVSITASHPAVLAHCSKSARWRLIGLKKNGSTRQRMGEREVGSSVGRAVVGFEFLPEPGFPSSPG